MGDNFKKSKNIRQGKIEIDFKECALIVNFETEVVRNSELTLLEF
jgi:hypothetical protein